jgi:hypothetical protein
LAFLDLAIANHVNDSAMAREGLQRVLRYIDICQAFCQTSFVVMPTLFGVGDTQKILEFMSKTIETTVRSILIRLPGRMLPRPGLQTRMNEHPQHMPNYCSYALIAQLFSPKKVDSLTTDCPACDWKTNSSMRISIPIHLYGIEETHLSDSLEFNQKHVMVPHTTKYFLLKSHLAIEKDDAVTPQYGCILCMGGNIKDTFKTAEALVYHIESDHKNTEQVLLELDLPMYTVPQRS